MPGQWETGPRVIPGRTGPLTVETDSGYLEALAQEDMGGRSISRGPDLAQT